MSFLLGGRELTEEEQHRSAIDYAACVAFEAFLEALPPDPDCTTCSGKGRYDPSGDGCFRHIGPLEWCPCVAVIPGFPSTVYSLSRRIAQELDERDGLSAN